jgi:hypothetical protein
MLLPTMLSLPLLMQSALLTPCSSGSNSCSSSSSSDSAGNSSCGSDSSSSSSSSPMQHHEQSCSNDAQYMQHQSAGFASCDYNGSWSSATGKACRKVFDGSCVLAALFHALNQVLGLQHYICEPRSRVYIRFEGGAFSTSFFQQSIAA